MENILQDTVKMFVESDIPSIRRYSLDFAKNITTSILNEDYSCLKDLINKSCEVRDEIEFEERIERTKEFYFGYCYAYENIGRRILEYKGINNNIDSYLLKDERIRKIIVFLGKEIAVRQKDLAEHMGMEPNQLANYLETEPIKKIDILEKQKIGRNVIYSLNTKGMKFYNNKLSVSYRNYTKEDMVSLIEYIFSNNSYKSGPLNEDKFPFIDESIFERIELSKKVLLMNSSKKKIYNSNNAMKEQKEFTKDFKYRNENVLKVTG